MEVSLFALLFSLILAIAVAGGVGWYMPHVETEDRISLKPYKFGYLVGSLYIFSGFLWIELLILDVAIGLIGHGFSADILLSLLVCAAL